MHILARFSKAIAALVPPTLGLMVAFGFDLTEDQRQAIMAVVAVVTPLVVAGAPANRDPAEAINLAGDGPARRMEARHVVQTNNGWQDGDPLDQPENPAAWPAEPA